jgi:hypothetical protein
MSSRRRPRLVIFPILIICLAAGLFAGNGDGGVAAEDALTGGIRTRMHSTGEYISLMYAPIGPAELTTLFRAELRVDPGTGPGVAELTMPGFEALPGLRVPMGRFELRAGYLEPGPVIQTLRNPFSCDADVNPSLPHMALPPRWSSAYLEPGIALSAELDRLRVGGMFIAGTNATTDFPTGGFLAALAVGTEGQGRMNGFSLTAASLLLGGSPDALPPVSISAEDAGELGPRSLLVQGALQADWHAKGDLGGGGGVEEGFRLSAGTALAFYCPGGDGPGGFLPDVREVPIPWVAGEYALTLTPVAGEGRQAGGILREIGLLLRGQLRSEDYRSWQPSDWSQKLYDQGWMFALSGRIELGPVAGLTFIMDAGAEFEGVLGREGRLNAANVGIGSVSSLGELCLESSYAPGGENEPPLYGLSLSAQRDKRDRRWTMKLDLALTGSGGGEAGFLTAFSGPVLHLHAGLSAPVSGHWSSSGEALSPLPSPFEVRVDFGLEARCAGAAGGPVLIIGLDGPDELCLDELLYAYPPEVMTRGWLLSMTIEYGDI